MSAATKSFITKHSISDLEAFCSLNLADNPDAQIKQLKIALTLSTLFQTGNVEVKEKVTSTLNSDQNKEKEEEKGKEKIQVEDSSHQEKDREKEIAAEEESEEKEKPEEELILPVTNKTTVTTVLRTVKDKNKAKEYQDIAKKLLQNILSYDDDLFTLNQGHIKNLSLAKKNHHQLLIARNLHLELNAVNALQQLYEKYAITLQDANGKEVVIALPGTAIKSTAKRSNHNSQEVKYNSPESATDDELPKQKSLSIEAEYECTNDTLTTFYGAKSDEYKNAFKTLQYKIIGLDKYKPAVMQRIKTVIVTWLNRNWGDYLLSYFNKASLYHTFYTSWFTAVRLFLVRLNRVLEQAKPEKAFLPPPFKFLSASYIVELVTDVSIILKHLPNVLFKKIEHDEYLRLLSSPKPRLLSFINPRFLSITNEQRLNYDTHFSPKQHLTPIAQFMANFLIRFSRFWSVANKDKRLFRMANAIVWLGCNVAGFFLIGDPYAIANILGFSFDVGYEVVAGKVEVEKRQRLLNDINSRLIQLQLSHSNLNEELNSRNNPSPELNNKITQLNKKIDKLLTIQDRLRVSIAACVTKASYQTFIMSIILTGMSLIYFSSLGTTVLTGIPISVFVGSVFALAGSVFAGFGKRALALLHINIDSILSHLSENIYHKIKPAPQRLQKHSTSELKYHFTTYANYANTASLPTKTDSWEKAKEYAQPTSMLSGQMKRCKSQGFESWEFPSPKQAAWYSRMWTITKKAINGFLTLDDAARQAPTRGNN